MKFGEAEPQHIRIEIEKMSEDLFLLATSMIEVRRLLKSKDFAKTLSTHKQGILKYYDHRIATGFLEGTNNKIRTLQRQAYDFQDQAFFMLRIYALHTTMYELVG